MAAVLGCGPNAVISHETAAGLWEIRRTRTAEIHLSLPRPADRKRDGVILHRRFLADKDVTHCHGIRVTTAVCTLIDIAPHLNRDQLEAAINEADKLDLVDSERLRQSLDEVTRRPGVGVLREVLDRRTFTLTDSKHRRRFIPLALGARSSLPVTKWVNGYVTQAHL